SEGQFRKAGVGRGRTWEVRPEIRTDFVHWIDPTNPTAPQAGWLALIEQLRLQINAAMFLGAFEYEGMLAVYPPGSFYRRHLDRFRDTPHRLVTVSLYLNDGWHDGTDADGGQLRLYLPRGGETTMPPDEPSADAPFVDVWPHAGTVVIFRSDLIWHEVLPSRRERHSLTGWLRRRS
ncbi:MAG: 2OG-Fe(II) oxygenase, partial [Planctomycetota bacterium]